MEGTTIICDKSVRRAYGGHHRYVQSRRDEEDRHFSVAIWKRIGVTETIASKKLLFTSFALAERIAVLLQ